MNIHMSDLKRAFPNLPEWENSELIFWSAKRDGLFVTIDWRAITGPVPGLNLYRLELIAEEWPEPQEFFRREYLAEFENGCNHVYIDVGFTHPRMVCKFCNKDL